MFNPHSAKTRIQNHLAYKLGLSLIQWDKAIKTQQTKQFKSKEESLKVKDSKANLSSFSSPHTSQVNLSLNPLTQRELQSTPLRGGGAK